MFLVGISWGSFERLMIVCQDLCTMNVKNTHENTANNCESWKCLKLHFNKDVKATKSHSINQFSSKVFQQFISLSYRLKNALICIATLHEDPFLRYSSKEIDRKQGKLTLLKT